MLLEVLRYWWDLTLTFDLERKLPVTWKLLVLFLIEFRMYLSWFCKSTTSGRTTRHETMILLPCTWKWLCILSTCDLESYVICYTRYRWAEYCDQFVCLSVCLQTYLWNRWTDLHKIFAQIPCGHGSVVLWRRCNTLCTSGFIDDVTFGCNGGRMHL